MTISSTILTKHRRPHYYLIRILIVVLQMNAHLSTALPPPRKLSPRSNNDNHKAKTSKAKTKTTTKTNHPPSIDIRSSNSNSNANADHAEEDKSYMIMDKETLLKAGAKLSIAEPPMDSYIRGSSFPVQVDLSWKNTGNSAGDNDHTHTATATADVVERIMTRGDHRDDGTGSTSTRMSLLLCTSLDVDPWFCHDWTRPHQHHDDGSSSSSLSSSSMRVYYTDTIGGSHDLKAEVCLLTSSEAAGAATNDNENGSDNTNNAHDVFEITPLHKPDITSFVNIEHSAASAFMAKMNNGNDNGGDDANDGDGDANTNKAVVPRGMINHEYIDHLMHRFFMSMSSESDTTDTVVRVDVPVVHFVSPAYNSTMGGTSVRVTLSFVNFNDIHPDDSTEEDSDSDSETDNETRQMFEIWFRHAFVCVNVDAGSASACFPLFENNDNDDDGNERGEEEDNKASSSSEQQHEQGGPLVSFVLSGLRPGVHTLQARLTRPDTAELTDESFSGTHVFYTTQ
jgi:hypothetical protein